MYRDPAKPSTWVPFFDGACNGCRADCCHLPVELEPHEVTRFGEANVTRRDGVWFLRQRADGACIFLDASRRCTVYESRPDTCRRFPDIGPRPGHCPRVKIYR